MKYSLTLIVFLLLVSCEQKQKLKENSEDKNVKKDYQDFYIGFLKPNEITPNALLDSLTLKSDDKFFVLANQFPNDWVKVDDVKKLILLVDSDEKCKCLIDPLSSYISSENSNIGGYVIWLINSFRSKKKLDFGTYMCPETNEEKAREIKEWWKKLKDKPNG